MTPMKESVQSVQSDPGREKQDGPSVGGDVMLCLITLDGQSLAIRTSAVREVIGGAVVVPVPLAPQFIAGIVNHRGVMLTTVSLRRVLGLAPCESKGCVIMIRPQVSGGEGFGLLVDQLAGVLTVDGRALENIPPTVATAAQNVSRGMYVREQGPLVELNAEHLRPEWLTANELPTN